MSEDLDDMPRTAPRLLLTTTEAAQALGIGRSKFYQLLAAGAVESVLIGSARRVPADALAGYVRTLRQAELPPASSLPTPPRRSAHPRRRPSSTDSLELPFPSSAESDDRRR